MKINKDAYKPIIVPLLWEEIVYKGKKDRVLVSKPVSQYIRSLENLIEKLKEKHKK